MKKPTILEIAQGFAALSGHVLMIRRPKLANEQDTFTESTHSFYWQTITKPLYEVAPLLGLKMIQPSNWKWPHG